MAGLIVIGVSALLLLIVVERMQTQAQVDIQRYHNEERARVREILRERVATACTLLQSASRQTDTVDLDHPAVVRTLTQIQSLRYDEGIGYIWIHSREKPVPRMIMHPIFPHLNGTALTDARYADETGRNPFVAMNRLCDSANQGIVRYGWPRPGAASSTETDNKISFVKAFEPLGLVVGSGAYLRDIDHMVARRSATMRRRINGLMRDIALMSFLTLTAALILVGYAARRIAEPLACLSMSIDTLSGDESLSVQRIAIRRKDEVGRLADGFNRMADRVHAALAGLRASNSLLDTKNKELLRANESLRSRSAELRASRERYYALFEGMPIGAAVYEPCNGGEDFTIREFNAAAEKMDFRGREHVVGSTLSEALPELVFDGIGNTIQSVYKSGKAVRREAVAIRMHGGLYWRDYFFYRLQSGEVVGMFEDITRRREAEHALKSSEKKYRAIFESITDVYYRTDIRGAIVLISPSVYRLYGYAPEDIIGVSVECFYFNPEDRDPLLHRLWREGDIRDYELRLKQKNGAERWASLNVHLITGPENRVVGLEGVIRDVTDRKIAEERHALQQEQLRQADKLKSLGVLVAGVAHEINNPNNFISMSVDNMRVYWERILSSLEHANGSADAALDSAAVQTFPRLFDAIAEGSRRIDTIVRNLKDFARKDPGAMSGVVNVNFAVNASLLICNNLLKKATDRLDISLDPQVPFIRGNEQQIEQVVVNLLTNAAQALRARTERIGVETRYLPETNSVTIRISDEGAGLTGVEQDRLFDPFYTTKREIGGTGIGLSISYSIVKEHCGEIAIESAPGAGACATVTLPGATRAYWEAACV